MTELHPGRRMSPFVVVSDTALRFSLLAAVTVASALYGWQYVIVVVRKGPTVRGYLACAGLDGDRYSSCLAEHIAKPLGRGLFLGVVVTLLVVVLVAMIGPALSNRASALVEPPGALGADLRRDIEVPARELAVNPPSVLLGQSSAATARMSSGGLGSLRLVLGGGMVLARVTNREAYDAVLAHEMAHVRNRDVRLREVVAAAWWALLVVVVLPYAVAAAASGHVASALPPLIKLVAVTLAARVIRNMLLQGRELLADVRASQLPGVMAPLRRVLEVPAGRRVGVLSSHPLPARRSAAIDRPDLVLRVSWLDVTLLAATGYFLAPALRFWLQQLTFGQRVSPDLASGVSWLVGGAIGLGVWTVLVRDDLSRVVAGGQTRLRSVVMGSALSVGTAAGASSIPLPGGSVGRTAIIWVTISLTTVGASLLLVLLASALARRLTGRIRSRRAFGATFWVGASAVAAAGALLFDFGQQLLLVTSLPQISPGLALLVAVGFTIVEHGIWLLLCTALGALGVLVLTRSAISEVSWLFLNEPTPARARGRSDASPGAV